MYIRIYLPHWITATSWQNNKEGNILFNDVLNTFYSSLHAVRHMVKDHSDTERGTRCRHMGYSFWLAARVLLYASHRQDNTYHSLCYTSRGALAGTRNSSMGSPHEGSIRRPIAPWANALTTEIHLAPSGEGIMLSGKITVPVLTSILYVRVYKPVKG